MQQIVKATVHVNSSELHTSSENEKKYAAIKYTYRQIGTLIE